MSLGAPVGLHASAAILYDLEHVVIYSRPIPVPSEGVVHLGGTILTGVPWVL